MKQECGEGCKTCEDGTLHIHTGMHGMVHTYTTCDKDVDPKFCTKLK